MKKIGLLLLLLLFCSKSYSQNPCPNVATVVYAGKTYNTVAIGDQCWLKENLDVGTRINGSGNQTNNSIIEKYCYGDLAANCITYGGLYQWNEAMQYVTTPGTQGICPESWHIPTSAEFTTLATTVSNDGYALKAVGQDGASTNTSGFSALLSGYRDVYYSNPNFFELGISSNFWSSSQTYSLTADYMFLYSDDNSIYQDPNLDKRLGFSVRCLNDLSVSTLLPVELNLFTAVTDGRSIQLKWSTQTEKNSDKFDIERKTIDAAWDSIDYVKASVLSNSPKQYSYTDKNLQAGKYQYRLKMIDNDGTFEYSKIVETEVALPKIFELSQNYPNPFNPSTKINYTIPFDSKVILEVYNITGKRIGQLVNEEQSAGYYSVDFNSTSLRKGISSGVYLYKITAVDKASGNNFFAIKKMLLLK